MCRVHARTESDRRVERGGDVASRPTWVRSLSWALAQVLVSFACDGLFWKARSAAASHGSWSLAVTT